MMSWWFLWMMFMVVLLVPSVGYGWGYRGWGPPYPRYIQRRRAQRASVGGGMASHNHEAWGWYGDLLWGMFFMVILCSVTVSWWR